MPKVRTAVKGEVRNNKNPRVRSVSWVTPKVAARIAKDIGDGGCDCDYVSGETCVTCVEKVHDGQPRAAFYAGPFAEIPRDTIYTSKDLAELVLEGDVPSGDQLWKSCEGIFSALQRKFENDPSLKDALKVCQAHQILAEFGNKELLSGVLEQEFIREEDKVGEEEESGEGGSSEEEGSDGIFGVSCSNHTPPPTCNTAYDLRLLPLPNHHTLCSSDSRQEIQGRQERLARQERPEADPAQLRGLGKNF